MSVFTGRRVSFHVLPRRRRTRWLLIALAVAACASDGEVKSAVIDKIIANCYQADEVIVTSGSGLSVNGEAKIKDPALAAKVEMADGHLIQIKGLRPARRKDIAPNILRPTLALASDPSYSGPNSIAFGDMQLGMDGQALALAPDAAALTALNAQKAANWSLVASAPIQVASTEEANIIGSLQWGVTFTLTPGQQADPDFPFLAAFRMSDNEPFEILSLSEAEIELAPVTGFIMGNANSLDATGDLSIAEGQGLDLDHLIVWNDTNAGFSGSIELAAAQGPSSMALWSSAISVGRFASVNLGAITMPAAAVLPAGDMELVVTVRDSVGGVVSERRNDLHVVGNPAAVVLTGFGAEIDLSAGGQAEFWIDGGAALAGEPYLVAMSASGGLPGMDLGAHVPLVWDAFTDLGLALVNTAYMPGCLGALDENGHAEAAFVLPAGSDPGLAGITLYFAPYLIGATPGSSAAPHVVELVP